MQVFKLVRPGHVDAVIGFDSLPEDILKGITRGPIAGWPRHWFEFMGVNPKDKGAQPFYTLDYLARNPDRQKWLEITSYVKRNIDPKVRLLDKVEGMALPVAQDSYSDITIDPEDMPLLPLPKSEPEPEPKVARGRRKQVEEAAAA